MTATDVDPKAGGKDQQGGARPWMRGVFMLVFAILFAVSETVLLVIAVIQFGWLLAYRAPQPALARFGSSLAKWLAQVARYQTAVAEERPFPWSDWPKPD